VQSTNVDIARFGLLSAFSLPFVIWLTTFTYDYAYRVEICQAAIGQHDEDLLQLSKDSGEFLGREKELDETRSLLDEAPSEIIVIAGKNEAGKTCFLRELLKDHTTHRHGVTHIQLAHLVDSISSFTHVFVNAFDLRWLQLRHMLVDVLPFAGSEILVMKERFSSRDLRACLGVITDALKRNAKEHPDKPRPVIVVDGLGEFPRRWMDSEEGKQLARQFFQWSIFITKERRLAHILLTGSEQLVMSLSDQNRASRGHVRVIGLGDLDLDDAALIVRSELPDATDDEIERITNVFGGFIHDVKSASRDIHHRIAHGGKKVSKVGSKKRKEVVDDVIKARFQQQLERVVAAFAAAREENSSNDDKENEGGPDDDEDDDPYLGHFKSTYSAAHDSEPSIGDKSSDDHYASWTQLQLWQTLKMLVDSPDNSVSFSELRDDVFGGEKTPILDLMMDDILSFEVRASDSGWFWEVTPASPAIALAFARLVEKRSFVSIFEKITEVEERNAEKKRLELERARLHLERKRLDERKKSLLQTIELGKEIGQEAVARRRLALAFKDIVREEEMHDMEDHLVRNRLSLLMAHENGSIANAGTKETEGTSREDYLSLRSMLKSSVLDIISAEEDSHDSEFSRLKKAFDKLDRTKDGKISAEDVVNVLKSSTGQNVSLRVAEQLVKDWDGDNDKGLNYYEFIQLLLSDDMKRRKA